MAKKARNETIEDITNGCDRECILKAIGTRIYGDRDWDQYACVGMFKKEVERKEGKKYTWTQISNKWVHEGHAEKFAKVYEQYKDHYKAKAMYNVIMGREPMHNNSE